MLKTETEVDVEVGIELGNTTMTKVGWTTVMGGGWWWLWRFK